ncbi:hypothetical protein [Colwellia sp. TT2012]|uniref:hypothetical protein n=1 Tax=Colwellia sp. TT2012 TaxID=1720342 RepID=UPI001E5FCFDD|nr:hypothetical protein [Colwellia sp. TT2012]
MNKHNPNNVRINRKYYIFLQEAKRQDESSIDGVAKAINRFEQLKTSNRFIINKR